MPASLTENIISKIFLATETISKHCFSLLCSLELVLVKQVHEHHWSSVVKGDDRGVYELVGEEAERVKEIHSRLEHLTSDKVVSEIFNGTSVVQTSWFWNP